MSDKVYVGVLPYCDFHSARGQEVLAAYDGKTQMGPWANMCEECFGIHGTGLGTGRGQRYVLREEMRPKTTWLDQQDAEQVNQNLLKFRNSLVFNDWLDWAGGDERFAFWGRLADVRVTRYTGVGLRDISDWGWRDAYDNGMGPAEAAREALKEDDTYSVLFHFDL